MPLPTVKNVSGAGLTVPALGGRLVVADAAVEVSEGSVYGFTCQESNWAPGNAAAKKEHEAAHSAQLERNTPTPPPDEPAESEAVEADQKEND